MSPWWRRSLLAFGLAVLGTAQAAGWRATVTHVTDGDTVWVQAEDGASPPLKLRLLGIDAPERCQPDGPQASAALADRILQRQVTVDDARQHDGYGRLLGRLWMGEDDVGAWMVSQGHAWSYRHGRSQGPYVAQEMRARQARLGLFAQPDAEEPRGFRKRHGPCDRPSS